MTRFSIGLFDFIDLSRPPSGPKFELEREVRPGVEGVTFWSLGRRSAPYTLTSVRDCEDISEALNTLAAYQGAVGSGPLALVWAGVPQGQVIVHDVEPLDGGAQATLLAIGGVLGTSRAILRCAWTLEYVPPPQQQQ